MRESAFANDSDSLAVEDLLRDAAALPTLPPRLRRNFLDEAVSAYHRSRRARRLHLVTALASVLLVGVFLSECYVAMWFARGPRSTTAQAGSTQHGNAVPAVRSPAGAEDRLLAAMSQQDSWALVEAFGEVRDENLQKLRGARSHADRSLE